MDRTRQEERCKLCGRIIHLDEAKAAKNRENGKLGGRPINHNSKRQIKLRNKLDK